MPSLQVAVIGTGNMGRHHARIYAEMPEVDLVGVVDPDEARGRAIATQHGTSWYAHHRDLPATVQAVSIVVPTRFHAAVTLDCLDRGMHVLVEKPIAVDLDEAQQMIERARERGLVLQVGHVERFNPAVRQLKQVVQRPFLIETQRLGFPSRRNTDVGIIWDLMIHDLDILLDLVGEPVEAVHATGVSLYSDFEDMAAVELRFRSGCVARLLASRVSGERLRTIKVVEQLEGGVRTLNLDFIAQSLTASVAEDDKPGHAPQDIQVEKEEPLRSQLEHFADCARHLRTPLVSGEAGRRALELAITAVQNMKLVDSKAPRVPASAEAPSAPAVPGR